MLYFMVRITRQLLVLMALLLFFLLCPISLISQPALAVLRQHQDEPGVMRYHSQESLRDASGNAWQVVLFKQITPEKPIFNLRLVAFPGLLEFVHPQPLEITTASGQILTATDVFIQASPAPNVGQYNVTNILEQLPTDKSLTLAVPLQGEQTLSLKIPQPLVMEWHWLRNEL